MISRHDLCFYALGIVIGAYLKKNCTLANEKVSDGGGVNVAFCKKIPTVTHTIGYLE